MSFLGPLTQAAGMSTAKWMELPARLVDVSCITPTQQVSGDLWHEPRRSEVTCRDPWVHIVKVGSVFYLEDGHHRWARARRLRDAKMWARVLEVRTEETAPERESEGR